MNVIIVEDKKYIATYPIFLFYLFIDWFTLFIWSYFIIKDMSIQITIISLLISEQTFFHLGSVPLSFLLLLAHIVI